jgi:hypothetical protein
MTDGTGVSYPPQVRAAPSIRSGQARSRHTTRVSSLLRRPVIRRAGTLRETGWHPLHPSGRVPAVPTFRGGAVPVGPGRLSSSRT